MGPKSRDTRSNESNHRSGAKGQSKQSKSKSLNQSKPSQEKIVNNRPLLPLELQQLLLNIFSNAFSDTLQSTDFSSLLQEVKKALFERDFAKAFGREDYLESYAARFSPTRALCYARVLIDVWKFRGGSPGVKCGDPVRVVCFGGAAAEVVAFGGLLNYIGPKLPDASVEDDSTLQKTTESSNSSGGANSTQIDLLLVDTAAWGEVVRKLSNGLEVPPVLSKYASASAKANNAPLLSKDVMKTRFQQVDALTLTKPDISAMLGENPTMITLLFTLNELYTSSISKTTAFLLHLTASTKPGSLLLVLDSPGSYSEAALGKESKKYPMKWLLDHTLLEKARIDEKGRDTWEKVMGEDSEWFRLDEKLRYSIPLEDMRYQIHLYRRL